MESLAYSALLPRLVQQQTVKPVLSLNGLSWSAIGSTVGFVLASTSLPAGAIVGRGATCTDVVRDIQEVLTAKGYNVGGIDGIFGNNTYDAIVRFQQAENLKADGVVGSLTAKALGLSGEVYSSNTNCSASPIDTTAAEGNQYTVTADALNVRSAPNLSADVVDILFQDEQVEVIATESGWLEIEDGKWISAQFVEPLDSTAVPEEIDPEENDSTADQTTADQTIIEAKELNPDFASGFVVVTVDALNVRTGPSTTEAIVGYVAGGETLPLTGRATKDGWVQVGWGDWIHSDFVEPLEGPSTDTDAGSAVNSENNRAQIETIDVAELDAAFATRQIQIATESLNVRSGPGITYAVVGTLLQDEVVPLTGQATENGWVQLGWGDWVSSAFVNPVTINNNVATVES